MKLISERCTKLMPFFTPTFFQSAHNQFLVDFAQWSQMETHEKISGKIIPIVSEQRCDIPAHLSVYSNIKYDPNTTIFNFWERLVKTINPAIKFNPELAPQSVKMSGPSAPSLSKMSYPEKSKSGQKNSEKVKSDEKVKEDKKKPKSTKQGFSNILVREDRERLEDKINKPSSLESEANGNTISPTFSFPSEEISDTDTESDSDDLHRENWKKNLNLKSLKKAKLAVKIMVDCDNMISDLNPSEDQLEQTKVWLDYNSPSPPFPPGFSSDEFWSPDTKKSEEQIRSFPLRKTIYRKRCESDHETEDSDTETEEEDE